jgi:hypothetical protein
MREPSFDSEFMNGLHLLASEIFDKCIEKGLSLAQGPLKDLKQALNSHLQPRPPRTITWSEFKQLDWTEKNEAFSILNSDVQNPFSSIQAGNFNFWKTPRGRSRDLLRVYSF